MLSLKENMKSYELTVSRFEHPIGTVCYDFLGYDYGLSNDDSFATEETHINVTLSPTGGAPFFTVPASQLKQK
jgi:hypothetical protein